MPLYPTDYSKTIIYKIVCNDLSVKDCYVGHTTDFTRRKRAHKHHTLNEKSSHHNLNLYQVIRDNGSWNNWSMIEIEKVNCADSLEARKRERYWLESLNANLNCSIPSLTKKEYREIKQDHLKTKCNCECGGKYTITHKAQHFKTQKHQKYLSNTNISECQS